MGGVGGFAQDDNSWVGWITSLVMTILLGGGWAMGYAVTMQERMYYTYIVASRSHNFYVGVTSGIEVRVRQHKEGRFDGYSKKYNCNRLVWFERHPSILDAIAREKQLKGWTRAKKITLIERDNPVWVDLSEEWGKPMKLYGER